MKSTLCQCITSSLNGKWTSVSRVRWTNCRRTTDSWLTEKRTGSRWQDGQVRLMLRWEIYIITYTATRNSFDPYTVTFQEMYLHVTELPGRLWFRDERSCQLTKLGHHHLQQKSKWSLTHEDQSKDRNQPGREAWPSSWNETIESVFNEPGSSPSKQQLLHPMLHWINVEKILMTVSLHQQSV